jgi:hypothetical protein
MSTTHDQRIRLALFIIERHFGEITRDVATTLLTTEHATLQQVVRKCGGTPKSLSPADVRAALLVLLHHNCLTVHLPPQVNVDGDAPSVAADRLKQTGLVYALSVDAVLHRLRIPKVQCDEDRRQLALTDDQPLPCLARFPSLPAPLRETNPFMRCDATATPAGHARRGALRDRRGRKHRQGARRARPPARVAGTTSHSSSSALLFYLLLTRGTALSSRRCASSWHWR